MTLNKNRARHAVRAAVLSALAVFAAPISSAHAEKIQLDVAAGEAPHALKEFIRQTGLQLIFDFDSVAAFKTHAVSGQYDAAEALTRMLSNTGLAFEFVNERTVTVTRKEAITQRPKVIPTKVSYERDAIATSEVERVRLAQAVEAAASSHETTALNSASKEDLSERRIQLEEVVVTGSHIRGATNLSSPVIAFDRVDIERAGYATTQDLVRSLPQNLSNISDTTFEGGNGGTNTGYGGSGINLRGLGSESTLVLVNGRRLAAAGRGDFVDVSLIPLSAIERVEVLTDGASAIYGSDAVGGVVNMILRKDYDGAETRLRYGAVTEGSHQELQAGQVIGHQWNSGQVLASYEYLDRSALNALDRDFINLAIYDALDLIPQQQRHAMQALLSQRLNERIELSAELYYTDRKSEYSFNNPFLVPLDVALEGKQYGGSLGASVDLANGWQARVFGVLSQNRSDNDYFVSATGAPYPGGMSNESRLWSWDAAADGPIASAPGGHVRLAVGAQFRREEFVETSDYYPADLDRDISAGYAELQIPLVGAMNRRTGISRLDLSLAGRFEEYSDFGSTFNPKLGVSWAPVQDLNVRGTWGTSFRAPLLSQLNLANRDAVIHEQGFTDAGGSKTGLYLVGNGERLRPEESINWTVGFDFEPAGLRNFTISATYFEMDYERRLRTPFPLGSNYRDALMDPMYAAVVERNPDAAKVARLLQELNVTCYTSSWDPCASIPAIDAIVDGRLRNLANVRLSGLDVSFGYHWASPIGEFVAQLNGTQQFENRERLVSSAPETNQLNDVYRPVDLRVRSSISLMRGPLSATAFIHYTDDYSDRRTGFYTGQRSRVGSWTTVDLTFQYKLERLLVKAPSPATITLAAVNVFDKDPPFVGHNFGMHFDGVNANPLGRFISAQVLIPWGAR